jgi:hypothetical protein
MPARHEAAETLSSESSCARLDKLKHVLHSGADMSNGRSLPGTSLASETGLFRHAFSPLPEGVFSRKFLVWRDFEVHLAAVRRFLESVGAADTNVRATSGATGHWRKWPKSRRISCPSLWDACETRSRSNTGGLHEWSAHGGLKGRLQVRMPAAQGDRLHGHERPRPS